MAQEYKGKPVFKGIALGPVTVLKKQDVQVKREKAGDPESEIKKVEEMERLWEALQVNGFTESQIDRIAYGNAKRVLQAL